jgi:predicted oxidoreductase (fatty acid repression mutant protein)
LNQTKNYISVAVKKEETAFHSQMEKVVVLVDIMEVEMEELEHLQRAVLIILLAVVEEELLI